MIIQKSELPHQQTDMSKVLYEITRDIDSDMLDSLRYVDRRKRPNGGNAISFWRRLCWGKYLSKLNSVVKECT